VDTLLERLQAQTLRMAVLSNKPHRFAPESALRRFWRGTRLRWSSGNATASRAAPPAGAIEIAQRITCRNRIPTWEYGHRHADRHQAGMFPVGARGVSHARNCSSTGAAVLVERPEGLLKVVGRCQRLGALGFARRYLCHFVVDSRDGLAGVPVSADHGSVSGLAEGDPRRCHSLRPLAIALFDFHQQGDGGQLTVLRR
jgi:hypothetical protein